MSREIRVEVIYKEDKIEFIMPKQGDKISLDFNGNAMIEITNERGETINERGEMPVTFRAMDGMGLPLNIPQDEIVFTILN